MKQKTFTLFFLAFFLFNSSSYAQWESLGDNIIPATHRIWSIKLSPDNAVWAIATFDNFPPENEVPKIYRSADEGASWINSEIPAARSSYGWDISPIDSNNAFVALDTSGLYQTVDGGQNWNKVQNFIYRAFYVHFFNALEGWVLADDGTGFLVMCVTEDGVKIGNIFPIIVKFLKEHHCLHWI